MIQVWIDDFKDFSQKIYDGIISRLSLHELACSCAEQGERPEFIWYGTYIRHVKFNGQMLELRVKRVKCTHCGKTHAILPSILVPFSQITLNDQQNIIYTSLKGSTRSVLVDNPLIDESNVKYVLKNFHIHWKEKLAFLGLSVLDKLTRPCFHHFSLQFMQIRQIPNTLVTLTT